MDRLPAREVGERWVRAARDPAVADAIDEVYREAAAEVEARGPACWSSGRCCNFERSGHRLYVTGLEAALTLVRLGRRLEASEVDDARARGGCPFQDGHRCGVHAIRPMGCRVYFCDRGTAAWQHELSERLQQRLRALHDQFDVPYVYAEWRALLGALASWGLVTTGPGGPPPRS